MLGVVITVWRWQQLSWSQTQMVLVPGGGTLATVCMETGCAGCVCGKLLAALYLERQLAKHECRLKGPKMVDFECV